MKSITRRLPTLFGFLGSCIAVLAVSATGVDAAKALGGLTEGARLGAIAAMARGGQIRSPLSSADGAAMLQGTTQGARAGAISELATLFKADLSGQEAEAILGPESVLSEGNRQNAITALARAKRFGPSIGDDAALALKGTTQGARAGAISEIAPYLRVELPGQALATVLGSASVLTDGNRQNAITAIARSGRRPMPLSGADGAAILLGATQGTRAGAISELATLFKADLSGQEAEAILGPESVLSEGNRLNAITALARANRFGPSIGDDAALALKGTTQGARAGAIGEVAQYLRADLPGRAIATILGSGTVLSEGNRQSAIAALARAGKLPAVLSGDEVALILQGTSGQSRVTAIGLLPPPASRGVATTQPGASTGIQVPAAAPACDAPRAAIDKPNPTCRERWQTVIFRHGVGNVFFATSEYIDAWQASADTGAKLTDWMLTIVDLSQAAKSVMKLPDSTQKLASGLTKGNSMLLMLGFPDPDKSLGAALAGEAVSTMRSAIEATVDAGLTGVVDAAGIATAAAKVSNSLLTYANTVRYSRMRNTYTVALEYLRLLYRMGGDRAALAQSLGLAPGTSIQDCVRAVNTKSFGFPTSLTDASAYDPDLVEKVVVYWTAAISDYAGHKAP